MIGVIYARYSSDNQKEESIDGQLRECKAYAEKNGIQIVENYIDRALSAKTDNRPRFQQMIKDSASKHFEVILVWKLDRFARNRYDSAHYKNMLRKNGVKVVSITETISQGAEGILLESLLEGMAGTVEYGNADGEAVIAAVALEVYGKGHIKYCKGSHSLFLAIGEDCVVYHLRQVKAEALAYGAHSSAVYSFER